MDLLRLLLEISQRNEYGAPGEVIEMSPGRYMVTYSDDFYLEYTPDTSGKYGSIDTHVNSHWFHTDLKDIAAAMSGSSQGIYAQAEHPELVSSGGITIPSKSKEAQWLFDFYRRVALPVSQGKQPASGLGESAKLSKKSQLVAERIVNVPDVTNGNKTAKIVYHTELMQYRIRLYVDGKFESDSTHYEDSPKEALAVARKMTGLVK